jgi:hypothetical protein
MKKMIVLSALIAFVASAAGDDPRDLSNGVLIAHAPLGLEFTNPAPPEGWCQHYIDNFAIHSCEEQNPRIDTEGGAVWFILAAWDEEKEFCGIDFGFGDYDGDVFCFVDWRPCFPEGGGLELPTDNWPGPTEGTAIVGFDWTGNYVPIYHFVGYAYGAAVIPFGADPATGRAEFGNCPMPPPQVFEIGCLGGMGILTDGIECCPAEMSVCCVGCDCYVATEEECADLGGEWHPEWDTCEPNPCSPSPAEPAGWGTIKALFR